MIEIFSYEKNDGLEELILSNSIASILDIFESKESQIDFNVDAIKNMIAIAQVEQTDDTLFRMQSILVSLGWNLNDDIFLKEEVFPARQTPVNKPFNRMHNQDDIIGHMTHATLLDEKYNVVEDDFEHIAVSSVVYKAWRDEDKEREIANLISEILDGQWKVSMECLFSNFDYGLIDQDGKQYIIKRTPETSHLSKHLRKYKGSGTYNGHRIGRVLRDINFCGKGLVKVPGNPHSVVLNSSKKFFGAVASFNEIKELRMNELEIALDKLAKAEAGLSSAQVELANYKSEAAKLAEAKLASTIAEKDNTIASLQTDIATMANNVAVANGKIQILETANVEFASKYEVASAELNTIKSEVITNKRRSALLLAKVPEDRAEVIVKNFANANDEMFNTLIENISIKPVETNVTTTTTTDFSTATLLEAPLNTTNTDVNLDKAQKIESYLTKVMSAGRTSKGDK